MPNDIRTAMMDKPYLFSGVTYFTLGLIREMGGDWVLLDEASWVGETGGLADCIKNGTIGESEFLGDGIYVNMAACSDMIPWKHDLPLTNQPE